MSIVKGTQGAVYIINSSTAFSDEATTEDGGTAIYQIDDTNKRIWDPNTDITPSATGVINVAWQDEGIDWFTGRVKMTASGLTSLTISGKYVSLQAVGYIHGWTLSISRGMGDITSIGELWRSVTPLGIQATLTLERYRFDTNFDNLTSDDWILFKIMENDSSGFWCKAKKGSGGLTKAVGAVDEEPLSFEISSVIARV